MNYYHITIITSHILVSHYFKINVIHFFTVILKKNGVTDPPTLATLLSELQLNPFIDAFCNSIPHVSEPLLALQRVQISRAVIPNRGAAAHKMH